MARAKKAAAHYLALVPQASDRSSGPYSTLREPGRDAEFERQVDALCVAARAYANETNETENAQRDGQRSMERVASRIRKRYDKALSQNAIDFVILEDLKDRAVQREALSLRRRWFVIGRALDAAMADDPALAGAIETILQAAELRQDERRLLGLSARR